MELPGPFYQLDLFLCCITPPLGSYSFANYDLYITHG